MSLFKRSVVTEIVSHGGVVFSTLIMVWLSVLLIRLLGDAASGAIGTDVVLGLAAFSAMTALPVILAVALFIAVLTTVTRAYRESEMVVWFTSGVSLLGWLRPVLRCAVPVTAVIALLTLAVSPWAYRQAAEYRERFEQRSDLSKVAIGQFAESQSGARVFFAEAPTQAGDELGSVFVRVLDPQWVSVVTASNARIEERANGDRFLVLGQGYRYDLQPHKVEGREIRLVDFEHYGVRLESKQDGDPVALARANAERASKARPTTQLFADGTASARSQILWRLALPLAALNLALLAIPLGAVNPRLGRSGDLLVAGLIALLYMNLINLSRGWVSTGKLSFGVGVWLVHGACACLTAWLLYRRLRVKAPRHDGVAAAT